MSDAVELSVVVPVHNEKGNAANLVREIATALEGRAFEIIFVNDASTDETVDELVEARQSVPQLRILSHRQNSGQSRAIRTGVQAARAPVIGTLDGDGQNDPADLPKLYRQLTRPDAPTDLAMVMGRRASRKDTAWKRFGSRFANNIRQKFLKDGCDDSGCGIKVVKRDVFLKLPARGDTFYSAMISSLCLMPPKNFLGKRQVPSTSRLDPACVSGALPVFERLSLFPKSLRKLARRSAFGI